MSDVFPTPSSHNYLRALADAFDPVEGPVEFAPDVWARIRNAIYDVTMPASEKQATTPGRVTCICGVRFRASDAEMVKFHGDCHKARFIHAPQPNAAPQESATTRSAADPTVTVPPAVAAPDTTDKNRPAQRWPSELKSRIALFEDFRIAVDAQNIGLAASCAAQIAQTYFAHSAIREWISVKDRLPEADGDHVLTHNSRDLCIYTAYLRDGRWYHACGDGTPRYEVRAVTHWSELPASPDSAGGK